MHSCSDKRELVGSGAAQRTLQLQANKKKNKRERERHRDRERERESSVLPFGSTNYGSRERKECRGVLS